MRKHFKEAIQKQKFLEFRGENYIFQNDTTGIDFRVICILKLFEAMGVNKISNRKDIEWGFSDGHG